MRLELWLVVVCMYASAALSLHLTSWHTRAPAGMERQHMLLPTGGLFICVAGARAGRRDESRNHQVSRCLLPVGLFPGSVKQCGGRTCASSYFIAIAMQHHQSCRPRVDDHPTVLLLPAACSIGGFYSLHSKLQVTCATKFYITFETQNKWYCLKFSRLKLWDLNRIVY
jgi:hypothetical protein